jgi:simple sugar transport system permease protein
MVKRGPDIQLLGLIAINIAILSAGGIWGGERFLSPFNLQSMAAQVPEIGLLALGVTLAMIAGRGGIDLSGITLANLSGICAYLTIGPVAESELQELAWVLSFALLSVGFGLIGGLINGLIIGFFGVTSIIATLGTQLIFTGIAVVLTGGSAQTLGYIPILDDFGNTPTFGAPLTVWLFAAVALAVGFWLKLSKSGRLLYLMGSNHVAARFAGVQTRVLLLQVYLISGACAGLAGVVIAAGTSSLKWDYGSSYVLVAILIAVMAGVRPEGGYGRIICVVMSAIALQIMSSFFNFLALSNFFRDLAWGVLLLAFLAVSKADLSGYWNITGRRPQRD